MGHGKSKMTRLEAENYARVFLKLQYALCQLDRCESRDASQQVKPLLFVEQILINIIAIYKLFRKHHPRKFLLEFVMDKSSTQASLLKELLALEKEGEQTDQAPRLKALFENGRAHNPQYPWGEFKEEITSLIHSIADNKDENEIDADLAFYWRTFTHSRLASGQLVEQFLAQLRASKDEESTTLLCLLESLGACLYFIYSYKSMQAFITDATNTPLRSLCEEHLRMAFSPIDPQLENIEYVYRRKLYIVNFTPISLNHSVQLDERLRGIVDTLTEKLDDMPNAMAMFQTTAGLIPFLLRQLDNVIKYASSLLPHDALPLKNLLHIVANLSLLSNFLQTDLPRYCNTSFASPLVKSGARAPTLYSPVTPATQAAASAHFSSAPQIGEQLGVQTLAEPSKGYGPLFHQSTESLPDLNTRPNDDDDVARSSRSSSCSS